MRRRICAACAQPIIAHCTIKCGEMLVGEAQQGEMLVDELKKDTSMNEGGFSSMKGLNLFENFDFYLIFF